MRMRMRLNDVDICITKVSLELSQLTYSEVTSNEVVVRG
jgi:hypothetical protein